MRVPVMELMIDVGNTDTVLGHYQDGQLTHCWRLSSQLYRTEDECWVAVNSFFNSQKLDALEIKGVCLSSVVPDLTLIYDRMVKKYLHAQTMIISPELDLGLKIIYHDPQTVGADRICNAVAGKIKYGTPLIIIDFGTATTFDCINGNGDYLGGIICPGIANAAAVLHHKAAKLPKIELQFPPQVIGRSTEESMQSGIMYGSIEMIEGLLRKIGQELSARPKVVSTGGLAHIMAEKTKSIDFVDENLNIEGIYYIYKRNLNKVRFN